MSQECTQRDAQAKSVADLERERDNYAKTLAVKLVQHAELVEALERIAEYAEEPTEQPQDRLDFIEEELEAETARTPYGEDEEPPCRNGWEVSELLMERAGLIAQITLTKIGGEK